MMDLVRGRLWGGTNVVKVFIKYKGVCGSTSAWCVSIELSYCISVLIMCKMNKETGESKYMMSGRLSSIRFHT